MKKHAKAERFTSDLLDECRAAGYDRVAINLTHGSIPQSLWFKDQANGSVFAHKSGSLYDEEPTVDGWPAIWSICDEVGVSMATGHGHQKSVFPNMLIDGVYHLIDGQWKEIKEDKNERV